MGLFEEAIRINREKCKLHEGYNDWEIEDSIVKDILGVNPSLEEYMPRVEYNKKGQSLGANTYYFRAYLLHKSTNKGLRTQLVKALKKSGATDIYDSFSSSIFFNMDVDELVARLDTEKQQKLDQRKQAVSHIDIGKYKPSPTILQKIKDYQARGSRVNVKAIKDPDKLFTYYYAAKMIGFSQLLDAINDITPYTDSDILEAIDLNVKTEKQDIGNEGFLSWFQPLVEYCVDHNIKWEAIRRNPSNVEMDPDIRNGRIWTLAYTFTAKGQSFKLAIHTDEGGGRPKGYSLDEREFSSLHAVCDAVIAKLDNIRENLAKKKLRESIQALPGVKRVNISDFEELYWDPYRIMGTSRVTDNSLGSDVNYADIFYSEITYDEDLDQWNVYMGPYEDYAQGKTIAEAVKKAYGRLKGTLHKEISKKIDDPFFAESPEYNLTGKFEYIGSAIDDAKVKYDATSLEDGDWFEIYFVDYGHVDDLKNKEARESLRSRRAMKESYRRVR